MIKYVNMYEKEDPKNCSTVKQFQIQKTKSKMAPYYHSQCTIKLLKLHLKTKM